MSTSTHQQWILVERPSGELREDHFRLQTVPLPSVGEGQLRVRNRILSIDPANRAWMFPTPTYKAPVEPGDVMHGFGLGEVVESKAPGWAVGDVVEGMLGWQEQVVLAPAELTRRRGGHPLEQLMGLFGITGLTAYFGLHAVGRMQPGDTVLVSAAAGAVGSVAVQLAKIHGCRVIGIAGGPDKCRWLQDELGLDGAVDYKAGNLRKAIKALCPDGISLYFDNTGGDALAAALSLMNNHGRIVCCGNLSQYNTGSPAPGPAAVPGLLVTKRLRMEGFIVMDYLDQRAEAETAMAGWLADGRLKAFDTVVNGLAQAPAALVGMFAGSNRGKLLVRLD